MRVLALLCLAACGGHAVPHTAGSCDGPCPVSTIRHVIIVVQENHSFDNYFGRYCTAPTGSNPTCTEGPACCEAAPATEPTGAAPLELTDAEHAAFDPDHSMACEIAEIDGGKMDHYVVGQECASPHNFSYAPPALVKAYWDMARTGALADRYFQPIAGQSISNDLYLARAQFVFKDNDYGATGAIGETCKGSGASISYPDPTIGDLLSAHGNSWTWYAEGYGIMADYTRRGACPPGDPACPDHSAAYPCIYDATDVPFSYYPTTRDRFMRDYHRLATDLRDGKLPQVSYVKPLGFRTEHPGQNTKLTDGVAFVSEVAAAVAGSRYAADTLLLVTYDESGGYFDHVPPPSPSEIDHQPYGARVPLIAIGPFVRPNHISHATLEHSSLIRFIEWNWLEGKTGQLAGRDRVVHNIGTLLDPAKTGVAVPE